MQFCGCFILFKQIKGCLIRCQHVQDMGVDHKSGYRVHFPWNKKGNPYNIILQMYYAHMIIVLPVLSSTEYPKQTI